MAEDALCRTAGTLVPTIGQTFPLAEAAAAHAAMEAGSVLGGKILLMASADGRADDFAPAATSLPGTDRMEKGIGT